MGMMDQAAALRWVHDNVAAFGGDPGQVTLAGDCAGGAAAIYHMMSPLSEGKRLWSAIADLQFSPCYHMSLFSYLYSFLDFSTILLHFFMIYGKHEILCYDFDFI